MSDDLNLKYLQLEMWRIDVLVQKQVLRMQAAGNDANDRFRGLYVSDEDAQSLVGQPLSGGLRPLGALAPDVAMQLDTLAGQLKSEAKMLLQAAKSARATLRLQHLAQTFKLTPFEYDALLLCLAPMLDLRYERLYSYLQDDVTRKRASVNLVLDLLCEPGPTRLLNLKYFYDEAPLVRHRLIEKVQDGGAAVGVLGQSFAPDETIVAWLLGEYHPHHQVLEYMRLETPTANSADAALVAGVQDKLKIPAGETPVFAFWGPDQTTQAAAARMLALSVGQPLLTADLAALIEAEFPPLQALRVALRDARLTGAMPFITGWDTCLKDGAPTGPVLETLFRYPGVVVVGGQGAWQVRGVERARLFMQVDFPIPEHHQREVVWKVFVSQQPDASAVKMQDVVTELAGRYALTTGQIRDAVATARDLAVRRGSALHLADLQVASREHSNPRLGAMARKITPRYHWDDIILPDDQMLILRELVNTVRGRPRVLGDWGVGRKLTSSSGVTVLFAGEPGTGKTMSAEVVARELGLELYKIDLSGVVSKYIGETEKNLEQIFTEAQNSNAILFFDEADSIFGKRSEVKDAHDRYANLEISYLLQRMEAYDGVTVLATNLRANLDEAFTRRLQFVVDFPFPEAEDRLGIWETLFPVDVPRADDIDFKYLAETFKIAGGNIRNIIVTAAYLAAADPEDQRVGMRHMLHATRRELQKMGRLVSTDWDGGDPTALTRNGHHG